MELKIANVRWLERLGQREIDFAVKSGEIAVLRGPSGSGKTSILDLICAYKQPDEGFIEYRFERTILVHGIINRERRDVSAKELVRLGVGRGFQEPDIFLSMTVKETLNLVEARLRSVWRLPCWRWEDYVPGGKSVLGAVGIQDDMKGRVLSSGQQKALSVIIACAVGRRVVVIDEPFARLHENVRRQVAYLLQSLVDRGKCIVIAEHVWLEKRLKAREVRIWPGSS